MRYILKSYMRTYLKKWVETFGMVIFIVIIYAIFVGLTSSTLQLNFRYNNISNQTHRWDYDLQTNDFDVNPEVGYDLYHNHSFINNHPFLNGDAVVHNNLTLDQVYDQHYTDVVKKHAAMWKLALTISQLSDLNQPVVLGDSEVRVPAIEITNVVWWTTLRTDYYGHPSWQILSNIKTWQLNTGENNVSYHHDQNFIYNWADYKAIDNFFEMVPVNTGGVNNVVLTTRDSRLPTGPQEILINDVYARSHHLKIGDWIKLNNFYPEDIHPMQVYNNYRITGYGARITDLFPTGGFNPIKNNINDYALVYLPETSFHNYWRLFATNPHLRKVYGYKDISSQHLVVANAQNNWFTKWTTYTPASGQPMAIFNNYRTINFADLRWMSKLMMIQLQVTIFLAIGVVLIIIGFVFISISIRKLINQTIGQIGLFKAFGYFNHQISWLFSVKTFLTLIAGAIIGYVASFPLQIFINHMLTRFITLHIAAIFLNPWFMVGLFIIIPIVFTIITHVLTWLTIRNSPLKLLSKRQRVLWNPLTKLVNLFGSRLNFTWRLQMILVSKSFGKLAIIFVLFFFSSLLMVIQLDGVHAIKNFSTTSQSTYASKVDHQYNFLNFNNWEATPDGYQLVGVKNADIHYMPYDDFTHIIVPALAVQFHQTTQEYIALNRTTGNVNERILSFLAENLPKFGTINFDHQGLYVQDIYDFISQIISDAKHFPIIPVNELVKIIPIDSIGLLLKIMDHQYQNPLVMFNDVYYQIGKEAPYLALNTHPQRQQAKAFVNQNVQLNAINPDALDSFNFTGVSSAVLQNVVGYKGNNSILPAVITNKIAEIDNVHIGDRFSLKINTDVHSQAIELVVAGIAKTSNFKPMVYVGYQNFAQHYLAPKYQSQPLFNKLISKVQLIKGDINLDTVRDLVNHIKIQQHTFTMYLGDVPNYDIFDLLKNWNATYFIQAPPTTMDKRLDMFTLNNILINEGLRETTTAFIIFQLLDAILLVIILIITTSSVVEEMMNFILVLRSLGYKINHVLFMTIGQYLLTILIGFIIAYSISVGVWYEVINYFLKSSYLILQLPISASTPIIVFCIMLIIMILGWIAAIFAIKRHSMSKLLS